jgi:hypothetical protein
MDARAPLWRPFLTAAAGFAFWLVRQSPDRLRERSWSAYAVLVGMLAGCALAVWGIQRVRGQRWHWIVETLVLVGLLVAAAVGIGELLLAVRGE